MMRTLFALIILVCFSALAVHARFGSEDRHFGNLNYGSCKFGNCTTSGGGSPATPNGQMQFLGDDMMFNGDSMVYNP